MGETLVELTVCGRRGCKTLQGIAVDTGSTHSVITKMLAEEVGIEATTALQDVETAKGLLKLPQAIARITLDGKSQDVPILIHNTNIVGRTTLETLGFKINPVVGKLEPTPITT